MTGETASGGLRFAILLDCDNTLLDNDGLKADLDQSLRGLIGLDGAARFWSCYEETRRDLEYVDYLETLNRYRRDVPDDPRFPYLAARVLVPPDPRWVFPGALDAVAHLATLGTVAVLSDGDPIFQPAKVAATGLAHAVGDNVLVIVHKEQQLDLVQRRFPADVFVLVDDKPRLLAACKDVLGDRLITVHVRQGHYADDWGDRAGWQPDFQFDRIAQVGEITLNDLPGVR